MSGDIYMENRLCDTVVVAIQRRTRFEPSGARPASLPMAGYGLSRTTFLLCLKASRRNGGISISYADRAVSARRSIPARKR